MEEIEAYRDYLNAGGTPGYLNFRPSAPPRTIGGGPAENFVATVPVPSGWSFGSGNFGNAVHAEWEELLKRENPDTTFVFQMKIGATGVDATVLRGPNPFAPYRRADLKPLTFTGRSSFERQVSKWVGSGEVRVGETRPYYYDHLGNIYRGIPEKDLPIR
jgi:hypothetical protein